MRVTAIEGYKIWAETYDTALNPLIDLESRILPRFFAPLAGTTFADLGCGTGRWALYARREGARVIALDLSAPMLDQAAAKNELAGALVCGDACALPASDAFADTIVCSLTIAYLPSLRLFAQESARIARPGAKLVISDLHPEAAKAGWKRSFESGGETYELDHAIYTQAQILDIFSRAGWHLCGCEGFHFGEPQRSIFRNAGKGSFFAEARRLPALWIGSWRKA
jgi:malonyl-CoA O-methyltransferase